ncbi:NrsF family protein [Tropicimonas aquimaris]|uniref:NrsF family protein n=1 Tax=Tropicimonas aquimaris TaxID=914152 RepID=A0ABW3INH6_9RHOB
MKTEDLIASLAAEPLPPAGPSLERRAAGGLAAGAFVTLALFAVVLGPRAGLGVALSDPVTLAKTVLPLLLGVLSLGLVLRASRPAAPSGAASKVIWAVPATVAALFAWSFATTAAGQRLADFVGHSIHVCLPSITVLSLPILAGLLTGLRKGAPVNPVRCGALAGLASAGLATAIYSLFCTEDTPLFYGIWYSLGILIVAGLGAILGNRFLRW